MQFSRFFSIITIILCSLLATSSFAASSKVLIMGDSLSAAYNISIEQSWPVLFEQKLLQSGRKITMVNASISGETTSGGVERLPALLEQHKPTHMILELGGNDGLRGFPFSLSKQNLKQMIEMAQQKKIQVLMIGVRLPPNLGPVYNQRFQKVYQQLSDEMEIHYLPRFLEGIAASKPEYMQDDGIHPTALAQPILADKVFQKYIQVF